MKRALTHFRRWLTGRALQVWYSPEYRLPIPSLETGRGIEPRRADYVAWTLLKEGAIARGDLRDPQPVPFSKLTRVHTEDYLDRVDEPEELARILGVVGRVPVEATLMSMRRACGGTVAATRHALTTKRPAMNLLGGFHHAGRAFGGGLCVYNDVAVAALDALAEGRALQVGILDLDAHPPDGLADCLGEHPKVWIGSLSAMHWGDLDGVDETVLGEGATGEAYLDALKALLNRMPPCDLVYVIVGGDVLAGDALGTMALSLEDAALRDQQVTEHLDGIPSVWLPGGGYTPDAWRVLAHTGLLLATGQPRQISSGPDPLREHYAMISATLRPTELGADLTLDLSDVAEELGVPPPKPARFLDFYTPSGIEHALERFGVTPEVRRLGYSRFRVVVDHTEVGDRARMFGWAGESEHLLMETVAEVQVVAGLPRLFIHWVTLRHPMAQFSSDRPRLPGQEVPGLGLSREMFELFGRISARLGLHGIVGRPSWFHMAYTGRHDFRFLDPLQQGRFEALVRDLGHLPLISLTHAVAKGFVLLNGEAYAWEAEPYAAFVEDPFDEDMARQAHDHAHFTLSPSWSSHASH